MFQRVYHIFAEADRDVSLEAVRETLVDPQLFDNLEDEISALNANLARCQIEKSMLEEEITRNSLQQNTQHEYQVSVSTVSMTCSDVTINGFFWDGRVCWLHLYVPCFGLHSSRKM